MVAGRVFSRLVEDVLSGRYEPGEKLPTQRALAAELHVNMASVREAVKRLEQLGLVEVRHGDAMRVTDWRTSGGLDVIAHVLFAAGGLDHEMLGQLMEARRLMLAEAARLAAERRDDDQARRLTALAERIAEAPDAAAAQALDFAFFAELVEAGGNVVLVLVMNSIRRIYFARVDLFTAIVGIPSEPYARGRFAMNSAKLSALAASLSVNHGPSQRGTVASAQTTTESATRFFGPETIAAFALQLTAMARSRAGPPAKTSRQFVSSHAKNAASPSRPYLATSA